MMKNKLLLVLFFFSLTVLSNPLANGLKRTRKRPLSEDIANPMDFWGVLSPTNSAETLYPFCKRLVWQDTGAGSNVIPLNKLYPAAMVADRLANFPGSCTGFCPCSTVPGCSLLVTPLGNLSVLFDATGTVAPFGSNLTEIVFNPGDGNPDIVLTGSPPDLFTTYTYSADGEYTVTLTATSDDNTTCSVSVEVNVTVGDLCPLDPLKLDPGLCGCGIDDSIDGTPCSTGLLGVCEVGEIVCSGGNFSCVQTVFPSPQNCSSPFDEDCNGFEGCGDISCALAPECSNGTVEQCFDEFVPPCNDSICIGLQRQCYTGPPLTQGVGACVAGMEICLANLTDSGCLGEITPAPAETCNPLTDEDCDGDPLNGFPDYGQPCNNGLIGACAANGTFVCNVAENATECDAPFISPVPEVCTDPTLDANCNGLPGCSDPECQFHPYCIEQCFETNCTSSSFCFNISRSCYDGPNGTVGVGICSAGVQTCLDVGIMTSCENQTLPQEETCDLPGVDSNCDGIDNNVDPFELRTNFTNCGSCFNDCGDFPYTFECCGGICRAGVSICSIGLGQCQATGPLVCNSNGTGTECMAVPGSPSNETCDLTDEDCNGIVDDVDPSLLDSDPDNCGTCFNNCSSIYGPSAVCIAGVCEPPCNRVNMISKMTTIEEPVAQFGFLITVEFTLCNGSTAEIFDFGTGLMYGYYGDNQGGWGHTWDPTSFAVSGNCTENPNWGNLDNYFYDGPSRDYPIPPLTPCFDDYFVPAVCEEQERVPIAYITPGVLEGFCSIFVGGTGYDFEERSNGPTCQPYFNNDTQATNTAVFVIDNTSIASASSEFTRCPYDGDIAISIGEGPPGPFFSITVDAQWRWRDWVGEVAYAANVGDVFGDMDCTEISSTDPNCAKYIQPFAYTNVVFLAEDPLPINTVCTVTAQCFASTTVPSMSETVADIVVYSPGVAWEDVAVLPTNTIPERWVYTRKVTNTFSVGPLQDFETDGTCVDAVFNNDETDVDCGGPACLPCSEGQNCDFGDDCSSGVCSGGVCVGNTTISSRMLEACIGLNATNCTFAVEVAFFDNSDVIFELDSSGLVSSTTFVSVTHVQVFGDCSLNSNYDGFIDQKLGETDSIPIGSCTYYITINVGFSQCMESIPFYSAIVEDDVTVTGSTNNLLVCTACGDGEQNYLETDVDCGGSDCEKCSEGQSCNNNSDCELNVCEAGMCDFCGMDYSCGGPCPLCGPGDLCMDNSDCATGLCLSGVCTNTFPVVFTMSVLAKTWNFGAINTSTITACAQGGGGGASNTASNSGCGGGSGACQLNRATAATSNLTVQISSNSLLLFSAGVQTFSLFRGGIALTGVTNSGCGGGDQTTGQNGIIGGGIFGGASTQSSGPTGGAGQVSGSYHAGNSGGRPGQTGGANCGYTGGSVVFGGGGGAASCMARGGDANVNSVGRPGKLGSGGGGSAMGQAESVAGLPGIEITTNWTFNTNFPLESVWSTSGCGSTRRFFCEGIGTTAPSGCSLTAFPGTAYCPLLFTQANALTRCETVGGYISHPVTSLNARVLDMLAAQAGLIPGDNFWIGGIAASGWEPVRMRYLGGFNGNWASGMPIGPSCSMATLQLMA